MSAAGCPPWCDGGHETELDGGVVQHSVTESAPGFLDRPVEVQLLQEGDHGPVLINIGGEAYVHLEQVDALVHTIRRVSNRERQRRFTSDVARRVSEMIGGPDPLLGLQMVADATGINRGVLTRRLLGDSPFNLPELVAIAGHLGVEVSDLVPRG